MSQGNNEFQHMFASALEKLVGSYPDYAQIFFAQVSESGITLTDLDPNKRLFILLEFFENYLLASEKIRSRIPEMVTNYNTMAEASITDIIIHYYDNGVENNFRLLESTSEPSRYLECKTAFSELLESMGVTKAYQNYKRGINTE